MFTLNIDTSDYNEKRYGKPWIARICFEHSKQGEFYFGEWVGEPGEAGMLILENVRVGDIVSRGQRDTRKMRNSAPSFYIVQDDKSLLHVSKIEAYKHFVESKNKE